MKFKDLGKKAENYNRIFNVCRPVKKLSNCLIEASHNTAPKFHFMCARQKSAPQLRAVYVGVAIKIAQMSGRKR